VRMMMMEGTVGVSFTKAPKRVSESLPKNRKAVSVKYVFI